MSDKAGTDSRRQRARVACKPCRQNKIRCGMRSPPCARCLRLKFHCTVDPCYRRVNQRDRVQYLEVQVQELQHLLQNNEERTENVQPSPPTPARVPFHPDGGAAEAPAAPIVQPLQFGSQAGGDRPVDAARVGEQELIDREERPQRGPEFTLGSVSLSETQGEELVRRYVDVNTKTYHPIGGIHGSTVVKRRSFITRFFRNFHPVLPFLDPSKNAAEYYTRSHLLFWSIIAVSARHYQTDTGLLMKVTPALTELLGKTISSSPISLVQIQALLLNSCWPLPNFRFWSDKSLVYANIALTNATQLGLHVRGYEQEYSPEKIAATDSCMLERSKAWAACEILYQSHTMDRGLPPLTPLREFGSTNQVIGDGILWNFPLELQQNRLIQNCSYRAHKNILGMQGSESIMGPEDTFYEKVQRIEENFRLLDWRLNKELSYLNSLRLMGAMLHYQCLYFLQEGTQYEEQKKSGILRAYKTASSIISRTIDHDSAYDKLIYAPVGILRIIYTAALVIFRVLHSTYTLPDAIHAAPPQQLDSNAGKILYHSACFILQSCSVHHNDQDFPTRMTGMLEALWRFGETDVELRNREPTSRIKSRMGASIVFDCLRIWREYKSGFNAAPQIARIGSNCPAGHQQRQQPQPTRVCSNTVLDTSAMQEPPGVVESDQMSDLNFTVFDGGFSAGEWGNDSESGFATELLQDTEDWAFYGFM
ncbi:Regulatory protein LEU3 [Penicillium rolfsii]|nr:Regulatory protein LEU3 [Penicillium rolfsii]